MSSAMFRSAAAVGNFAGFASGNIQIADAEDLKGKVKGSRGSSRGRSAHVQHSGAGRWPDSAWVMIRTGHGELAMYWVSVLLDSLGGTFSQGLDYFPVALEVFSTHFREALLDEIHLREGQR